MIKLVASDLDGTLLLHKAQSLPEEIFSLIRQLEELGIMFVAASGDYFCNPGKEGCRVYLFCKGLPLPDAEDKEIS